MTWLILGVLLIVKYISFLLGNKPCLKIRGSRKQTCLRAPFYCGFVVCFGPMVMGDPLSTDISCWISTEQGGECKQAIALGASTWAWSPATNTHVSPAKENQMRGVNRRMCLLTVRGLQRHQARVWTCNPVAREQGLR